MTAPNAGAPDGDAPATSPARVLLVDDHLDAAELLQILLSNRGFAVTIAGSVAAALAVAADATFDVLVSDLGLPDGSGNDLVRLLKTAGPLAAIALSGSDRAADIEESRAAGFDAHLSKPVSIDRLVQTILVVARQ